MDEYIKNLKLKNTNQTLESFINDINYSSFSGCFSRKKDKKKFKEHKIIGKKGFINFIGIPNKFDQLFLALDGLPPILWYKVTTTEEIELVMSTYLSNNMSSKNRIFRGFLGLKETSNLSYDSLQKFILLHPMADKIIWGPLYNAPNADVWADMNYLDMAINITKLTEQNTLLRESEYSSNTEKIKEVSFLTKYSRSIMTFTEIEDIFFVNVEYSLTVTNSSEIKKLNTLTGHTFEETLPFDVVTILSNFPKVYTCVDLLCVNPPEITISLMVASNIPRYIDETLYMLNNMYDNKQKYTKDVVDCIDNALLTLTINREFDRIFSKDMLIENESIDHLAEKIESHCMYNSQFKKETVISYIRGILANLV